MEAGCFRTSHLVYSFFLLFFFFLPSTTGTGVSQRGGTVLPHFVYSFFLFLFFPPLPQALESANVEAVIVFRTLSIFVTAYGDFALLQVFFFVFLFLFYFIFSLGHLQAQRGLYLQHKKQYRNGSKQD